MELVSLLAPTKREKKMSGKARTAIGSGRQKKSEPNLISQPRNSRNRISCFFVPLVVENENQNRNAVRWALCGGSVR